MMIETDLKTESMARDGTHGSHIIPPYGLCFLFGDIMALVLAFCVGGILTWTLRSPYFQEPFQTFLLDVTPEQMAIFFGLGAFSLMWLDMHAHYRQRLPYWEVISNIAAVWGVGLLMGGFLQFVGHNIYSRLWLVLSWGFFALFLYIGRSLIRSALRRAKRWNIPTLVIGFEQTAKNVLTALDDDAHMGYCIKRVLPAQQIEGLTTPGSWQPLLEKYKTQFLLLALEGKDIEVYKDELRTMARDRVNFSIVSPWLGLPLSSLSTHHFVMHDVMLMHDSNPLGLPLPRFLKRGFDIVGSSLALILLSPIFFFIFFMIRRDGGAAMFSQPRMGRNGKMFNCLKFRSMQVDAEKVLADYLKKTPEAAAEWSRFQKLKEDPRITKLGQFIRKTSLDEIPQLINVLQGDMSLVGPRPFMPGQEVYYGDDLVSYQSVRPGITGPWQVSGRNQLTFSERVTLEAWYTRNWTLWLDIVIILKTFPVLFRRDAAF